MSDFDAVKQRADIVDVVQQYVPLQRAGRYFKACCPFHQERTPSFYVFPDRQSWRCFGACSTGGDVFTFIEKKENLTPLEALRLLAERYGVPLSRSTREHHDEPERARLLEANEEAARFYHGLLLNAPAAEPARRYLEGRGLDDATIRAFQLGYAPDAWQALLDHLRGRGFTDEELLAAGLVIQGERGPGKAGQGLYDRFRGRVMFPIADERGRVIGFGGRVLGDGVPKYLNTPQTRLFDKGGTLYALDRAKDAIRASGAAVVVEGYMDAIAAHQHGITNVVATLGTALTERHITVLKRYARQVILAMDADAAGIEAALRGEELVRAAAADADAPAQVVVDWRHLVRVQAAAPLEVRVFTVPQGKDPDEAIRADPDAFRELTRRAIPPFEFRLQHELRGLDRNDPRARVALADRLLPLVAAIGDRALQAQYLARLAQTTAIPETVLTDRLRQTAKESHAPARPLRLRERVARPGPPSSPEQEQDGGAAPPDEGGWAQAGRRIEAACLRLLLTYRALRPLGLTLEAELFHEPAHRALFAAWRAAEGEVQDALPGPLREHVSRILAERLPPYDEPTARRALEDIIARLRLRHLEDRARLLAAAVAEAEATADPAAAAALALAALSGAPAGSEGDTATLAERLVQHMDLTTHLHMLEAALRTTRPADPSVGATPAQ